MTANELKQLGSLSDKYWYYCELLPRLLHGEMVRFDKDEEEFKLFSKKSLRDFIQSQGFRCEWVRGSDCNPEHWFIS